MNTPTQQTGGESATTRTEEGHYITPIKRGEDGTTLGFRCSCGGFWKVYQKSYHTSPVSETELREAYLKDLVRSSVEQVSANAENPLTLLAPSVLLMADAWDREAIHHTTESTVSWDHGEREDAHEHSVRASTYRRCAEDLRRQVAHTMKQLKTPQ